MDINVELLATVMERVDESLEVQGLVMSNAEKAKAIAALYASSHASGEEPGSKTIDRMVWMNGLG